MTFTRKSILIFTVKLFLSFTVLSVVFYLNLKTLVNFFMPLVESFLRHYSSEIELISIAANDKAGGIKLDYSFKIIKQLTGLSLPLIETVSRSISAAIIVIPYIIFYSLLFSWPGLTVKKRVLAALVFFPILSGFYVLDSVVTIISSIEIYTRSMLRGIKVDHSFLSEALLSTSHFFNNGGRQFMAVLMFAVVALPFRRTSHMIPVFLRRKLRGSANRNDSCPCGSGKKYKNCCG